MSNKRNKFEQEALKRFEDIAKKYSLPVFKKQGNKNRIFIRGRNYFQFGDLRVETKTHHVIVEVESAGGNTNLVKYWWCIKKRSNIVKKPILLMHIFQQSSPNDFGAHLVLWDFMYRQMKKALKGRIEAFRYTYSNLKELKYIAGEFEKYLKK